MTGEEKSALVNEFLEECRALCAAKAGDYNEGEHPFANFERIARQGGITAPHVMCVLMGKQFDAVVRHCRGHELAYEGVEDKLKDIAIYSALLAVYLRARREGTL